ncbi:uncharacterized protein LOC126911893 [Spodoptera frugiperda]|uniref:Uncharacterized protein LOC126911893 n=1 Tax=Spodoptera frugiperda TaxID=7108 RepID=A0A9R0F1C9_SPOFR|nr:uncharacterized protein LOC126911893 [Spodoptera frugiperda]XP_050557011.1 uncharacterized protein LOC126911893 [Spodoptera frugiperda]XP_050557012.1 uncharacterized protein LOC126911893 [Spodoptera frugiperda]XP_050557014.1 uncharacterized protein LOC126911893 [Spodoptera frugiperda]
MVNVLHANDIKSCIVHSKFLMYADDIKIYKACTTIQDCLLLQEDLCRLSQYCLVNKLHLSLPKCFFISFTKNKISINFQYTLNNTKLNKTECARDLGVLLDCKLHLDAHVDNRVNKALQMYGFVMRSCRDFRKPSTYLFLFKTLIRSQLEYAVPIWCPFYEKYKNAIEMVQKRFLRATHYKCFRNKISYTDLLKYYKILSLDSRRSLLMVMMLYGICNNKFNCIELSNELCYVVPRIIVQREVRVPQLFYTARCRTNAGVRAPLRQLVATYNSHFIDLDIFALSQSNFRKMACQLLADRP